MRINSTLNLFSFRYFSLCPIFLYYTQIIQFMSNIEWWYLSMNKIFICSLFLNILSRTASKIYFKFKEKSPFLISAKYIVFEKGRCVYPRVSMTKYGCFDSSSGSRMFCFQYPFYTLKLFSIWKSFCLVTSTYVLIWRLFWSLDRIILWELLHWSVIATTQIWRNRQMKG